MKHYQTMIIFMSSLLIGCSFTLAQSLNIPLNSENIKIYGANYVHREANKLSFSRFSEKTLEAPMDERMFNADKARTNSGIKLQFITSSANIKLTFSPQYGLNRGAEFAVLQNGTITQTYTFKSTQSAQDMVLDISSQYPNKTTLFEVVLPSFCNVALSAMQLNPGNDLVSFTPKEKPVYLALGNSITHGVGQGSASYLTYPYVLAQQLDMDYYNLAVGGAKISSAIAAQTAEMPQADIITILIGYNDLMFNNKSVAQYTSDYQLYLAEIRKNQPTAKIYCISLTHTRAIRNETTGIIPDDYRTALKNLVNDFIAQGDDKLFLIAGDAITSEANLRSDVITDKVHFGIDGARMFAEELYSVIRSCD